jgi:DNA-binding beta-propeller fold protein YncE
MTRGLIAIFCSVLAGACASVPETGRPAPWPDAVRDFATPEEAVRVAAQFPNSAGMLRRRLAAAIQAKDAVAASEALRRLAAMGAVLSEASQAQAAALVPPDAMAAAESQFAANARPVVGSSPAFAVSPDHRLIEGLAIHPKLPELYVTSVVDRQLVAVHPHNGSRKLDIGSAGSLLGAVFDPRTQRLWAASAVLDETPRSEGTFSGLISVDPANPAAAVRIPAPAGASPGDVAVAADGTVYASDGLNGAVYVCRPGCPELGVLLPPGRLFSAQGMAVSEDQSWLYVADRRYGIAAVERSSGRIVQVLGEPDMMLDGIDGLVRHRGDLIATQTAYAPQRIIRLRLSSDGTRVTRLDVLERANPEWGEVTLAAAAGDRLLYVAGAQWERFGEGGVLKGEAPLRPTGIRMLKLK